MENYKYLIIGGGMCAAAAMRRHTGGRSAGVDRTGGAGTRPTL